MSARLNKDIGTILGQADQKTGCADNEQDRSNPAHTLQTFFHRGTLSM
jgi:hypothetical protein